MSADRILDLSSLPEAVSNGIVEDAFSKAATHRHDSDLDAPHHEPIVRIAEDVATEHGRSLLQRIWFALVKRLQLPNKTHRFSFQKAENFLGLLGEVADIRSIDDLLKLVDAVFAEYAPVGQEQDIAKQRIVQAFLAGQHMGTKTLVEAKKVYPVNLSLKGRQFRRNAPLLNTLRWMQAAGAEHVRGWNEASRGALRKKLIESQMGRWSTGKLQTELFREFAEFQHDWRRIAITESNEAAGQGFIASLAPGTKVKRVEMEDCCPGCRKFRGQVFVVVDPLAEAKRGEMQVWVGKDQSGRSSAPHKMVNGVMVPRQEDELWWCPSGAVHPSCRGSWTLA